MRIIVRAKPGAKKPCVERLTQPTLALVEAEMPIYRVAVKEPAVDGKANEAIIRAIAEYFDIASSRVTIVGGQSAKRKIVVIQE